MFEKQKNLLDKRIKENTFRKLSIGKDLVDFCSNDYLGFSKLLSDKKSNLPVGATGSRLLSGNYELVEIVEGEIAQYHKASSALLYNSGYAANVGFFSAVPQKGDTVLYDELIHASVKDGIRLSFCEAYSFKHNNIEDLKNKLKKAKGEIYVVVEAVYSMDGDQAPLKELVELSNEIPFVLIVDEAHSVGVYGKRGEGLVVELGLEKNIPVRIVTFGKAIGCHGAMVLSDELIKNFLINFSRSFIYSTALPPSSVFTLQQAYLELSKAKSVKDLRNVIQYFKQQIKQNQLSNFILSDSAIHCLLMPGVSAVKQISEKLIRNGFDVRPILSPTVPIGKERIRICLHSYNTEKQIDNLFALLKA